MGTVMSHLQSQLRSLMFKVRETISLSSHTPTAVTGSKFREDDIVREFNKVLESIE